MKEFFCHSCHGYKPYSMRVDVPGRKHAICSPCNDKMAEAMASTKTCGACGEVKSVAEFYKRRRSKDGLQSKCRACDGGSAGSEKRKANDRYLARLMRNA